jgi:VIT1/CCC1 family predicted Fe2+/Mn2+ transporter
MATINQPFSGITDLLGLTRYHHLAKQVKETIELYELTSKDSDLDESSKTLRRVINAQVSRLSDLDTKADRLSSYSVILFKLMGAAYMLTVTFVALSSHWTSSISITVAALSSFTTAVLIVAAFETLLTQQKTESKRAAL